MVSEHVGLDLLGVGHGKDRTIAGQLPGVTDLPARLRIEGRRRQHHDAMLTGLQALDCLAVLVQRKDGHVAQLHLGVADEGIACAAVFQRPVHAELAGGAPLRLLPVHGGVKAGLVDRDAALAADIGRQVQRKAEGVMQLEGHVAGQHLHAAGECRIEDQHAVLQGLEEALLFQPQHLADALLLGLQARIGLAHQPHQVWHQTVQERRLAAQLVAVADGAAHDPALHIAAALVAGDHAVADQKGGGADVVGDHLERVVPEVRAAGLARRGPDQRLEDVDLVIAVHVLKDRGQPLQAHAGVDARRRQVLHAAVGLHVELHEHMVPDLDIAVAFGVRAAGRAAGDLRAVVEEDLGAGAAGPGVGHHPEIVGRVLGALVVADPHHPLGRQADLLGPDVVGLVVVDVDRGPELVGRQPEDLGQQFPAPDQAVALEVVAKAPVAQHLEEGVVPRRVADVFQVVVLAAGAQAGLDRGGAHVGAGVGAEEHVLELHHAGIGEHQRRVVARHQRTRRDHGVALGCEEVEKGLADVGNGEGIVFH